MCRESVIVVGRGSRIVFILFWVRESEERVWSEGVLSQVV